VNAGLNVALGTHFQRIGVNAGFYFTSGFLQLNTEARFYYSFRNLGPRLKSPELVLSQGIVFGCGVPRDSMNLFYSAISNQTKLPYSFAYAYNAYFNRIKTSQRTGTIAFQFYDITFIADNDILAKPMLDRFRTGSFLLQYQYLNVFQAAANISLWTGQLGNKCGIINPHFYYQCYMDTTNGKYTNTSHGLLSGQFKYRVIQAQYAQINAGIDAEQVRNAIQNHLIHDMRFIPKKYNKARNCHLPMLDQGGNQYLYKDGQEIRKAKPYINLFANPAVFY